MQPVSPAQWLGQQNTYLVDVGRGHFLHPDVVDDFVNMQRAAIRDGIDLQLVSSYRNFDRQMAIFNRKWRGEATLLDSNGHPLDPSTLSEEQKLHAILTWSALPGGSRHHWGTDIDVYDKSAVAQWHGQFNLVESEYDVEGPCYALANWLTSHMHQFGFYRPFEINKGGVAREPWHLSHRSTATYFEQARRLEVITDAIENSEIQGKSCVLTHLPALYERYVLNRGWNSQ
ncbi:M15 family metallopeptidase [Alteromonas sp. D210916BOD_24]|uniref:M15 family metallopeptidase n=1 Tax=Alteromonas sp. D210916BOD_24 TaxID=3157618 RepID=UPI00399C7E18